jgi:hypothetical protein
VQVVIDGGGLVAVVLGEDLVVGVDVGLGDGVVGELAGGAVAVVEEVIALSNSNQQCRQTKWRARPGVHTRTLQNGGARHGVHTRTLPNGGHSPGYIRAHYRMAGHGPPYMRAVNWY